MSTFPFPPVTPNDSHVRLVSNTEANRSPHTGKFQTVDRQGECLVLTMSFRNLKSADRRRMQAWVARMNGHQHRFTAYDHSYEPAGVLAVSEMLDVPFNATNWEASTSGGDRGSISAIDGGVRFRVGTITENVVLRAVGSVDGISAPTAGKSYSASLSSFDSRPSSAGGAAPPVLIALHSGQWSNPLHPAPTASTEAKRHVVAATAPSASALFPHPWMNADGSGEINGTVDVTGLSVARALLVDNGFNALIRSEEFDNAAWTKSRTTVSANVTASPDGVSTADELVEDSTPADTHAVQQSYARASVAEYWTASVFIKSNTSRRIGFRVEDGAGNGGYATFDATSGQIEQAPVAQGTATNAYGSMVAVGSGWYRCRISARIPATTTARLTIFLTDGASNTISFNGDGTSGLYIWGAQLQRGGQLGRYVRTTTTATTGTGQTGKRIWVKGLDAGVAGQRKQGDQVEINGHLAILTADLDGDASGVGLLEISPRIPTAPADEAPVVLYRPHGKWILVEPEQGWSNRPGAFSDFTIEAIQDLQ